MVFRQKRQRLGISQRREPVSTPPVVWYGATVPKQPVILLNVRVEQEVRLDFQKRLVSGQRVGPPQQRPGHEHILGAVVRIAGRWRRPEFVAPVKLCCPDQNTPVPIVAGRLEHLVAPYQPRVSRTGRRLVVPRLLSRQILRYQVGYAVGIGRYFSRKRAKPQPPTQRDALSVYNRVQSIPVSLCQRLGDVSC